MAEEVVGADEQCVVLHSRPGHLCFLPKSWSRVLPENRDPSVIGGYAWDAGKRWAVKCQLTFHPEKISLFFEIARMEDRKAQVACVKRLDAGEFSLGKIAFTGDAKYSKFFSESRPVPDMADEDAVRAAITHLLAKAKEKFPAAEKAFREVFGQR